MEASLIPRARATSRGENVLGMSMDAEDFFCMGCSISILEKAYWGSAETAVVKS